MLEANKTSFKAKFAVDKELIAKLIYAIDLRVQLLLTFMEKAEERELLTSVFY